MGVGGARWVELDLAGLGWAGSSAWLWPAFPRIRLDFMTSVGFGWSSAGFGLDFGWLGFHRLGFWLALI